jgi:predicted ribosomally synthesized peptide with SipW-like signal peptide
MSVKRNILFSLMMIGAVAALISGATFSAFTDTANITGSITAGNVQVGFGQTGNLSWNPSATCSQPAGTPVLGSTGSCTSTVTVNYTGNLPADMDLSLAFTQSAVTPSPCFLVELSWSGGGEDSGTTSPVELTDLTAANGTATVTVSLAELSQVNQDACQSIGISLTLTVTTTETTGVNN